jgi:hypothetical protein
MYQYDKIGKGVRTRYNKPMCLLNPIRTMVLFEVILLKKSFFIKRNFQMKYCNLFFILFLVAIVCHIFFENQTWVDINFLNAQILLDFVFHLEKWSQFQVIPYHVEMFKFYLWVINHNISLNNIYNCITFTCCKGFMNFQQTLIFYKHKIEKNMKIWVFLICF